MIDFMIKEMKKYNFDRIIVFGGGIIVDICKILVFDVLEKFIDLFEGEVLFKKVKELVVVFIICGIGSEVINVVIVELKFKYIKKGFVVEEIYVDYVVLILEIVKGLFYKFFVISLVDVFIYVIEFYFFLKVSLFIEMYFL